MLSRDNFFSLLANKQTTAQEVLNFLTFHKININHPYKGNYPIEQVLRLGNVEILKLFLETLKVDVSPHSKPKGYSLLELCIENEEVRLYLFNPDNQCWKYFNNGLTELHLHACAGRGDKAIALIDEDISQLFIKFEGIYSALDLSYRFGEFDLYEQLRDHLLVKISIFKTQKKYAVIADIYALLASFCLTTEVQARKAWEYYCQQIFSLEKALDEEPENADYFSQISIAFLNLGKSLTKILPQTPMNIEVILQLTKKAKANFKKANDHNLTTFNTQLAELYQYRRDQIKKYTKQYLNQQSTNFSHPTLEKLFSHQADYLDEAIQALNVDLSDNEEKPFNDPWEKSKSYSLSSVDEDIYDNEPFNPKHVTESERRKAFMQVFANELNLAKESYKKYTAYMECNAWSDALAQIKLRASILNQILTRVKSQELTYCTPPILNELQNDIRDTQNSLTVVAEIYASITEDDDDIYESKPDPERKEDKDEKPEHQNKKPQTNINYQPNNNRSHYESESLSLHSAEYRRHNSPSSFPLGSVGVNLPSSMPLYLNTHQRINTLFNSPDSSKPDSPDGEDAQLNQDECPLNSKPNN